MEDRQAWEWILTFSNLFDSLGDLDWLAVIVAAIAVFALAWVWYTPLFGKAWSAATGKEMSGNPDPETLAKAGAVFILFSVGVAYFVTSLHHMFQNPASFETLVVSSLVLALFIVGSTMLSRVVWEGSSTTLWAIDFGFWFLAAVIAAEVQDLMA